MQNPVTVTFEDANTPPNSQVVNAANPLPVGGGVASGAADSGNPVKIGGVVVTGAGVAAADNQRKDIAVTPLGAVYVAAPIFFGTAGGDGQPLQGLGGRADSTNLSNPRPTAVGDFVFNGTNWDRQAKASATSRIVSAAANTNATSGKASAGTVYSIDAQNTTASTKYLKLYNKASAPTVGTDTPVRTIALPPSNARMTISFPTGLYFSTGIAYGMSGAAADADATALAAGDVVGLNIDYS